MLWQSGRRSSNVEDRRGMPMRGGRVVAGGMGGLGLIAVVVVALLLGVDPTMLLQQLDPSQQGQYDPTSSQAPMEPGSETPQEAQMRDFVSAVLGSTEDSWADIFQQQGATYQDPQLVLFTGAVDSACGFAQSAVGPFYCPNDQKVYLDLSFFNDLATRFGAAGDFAQAYVIAHEIGHHVQNLLGVMDQVAAERQRLDPAEANALSVRVELQADCLAGVWANHADQMRGILEPGDIDEALGAASAVGDDRIQQRTQGRIVPDAFTHGSSEERMRWFRTGFDSGDVNACDTFGAARL
ncbi:KPN_02809 family neutral zinc metallopeptidase [Marinivivus vitaminiproducens]|uniref:KPN_02809 family neutral zinc metallopeptidase n=1 Tax=Marinivivus vitaminiproducens TaxID=3035935 RepID=UPI0027A71FBB|nr:zinc metallopeptidase [Geminicoccaceae bacterium SCSIO 64248]